MSKGIKINPRQSDRNPTSLLADMKTKAVPNQELVQSIALRHLQENTYNPRRTMDSVSIHALAESIKEHTLLQPLIVRELSSGIYEVVAGSRRLHALRHLDATHADCRIVDITDGEAHVLALVENLQREDLPYLDELDATLQLVYRMFELENADAAPEFIRSARKLQRTGTETDLVTQEQLEQLENIFHQIGLRNIESFITNRFYLLSLPDDILTALRAGEINLSHAQLLGRMTSTKERARLTQQVIGHNPTKQELQALILQVAGQQEERAPEIKRMATVRKRLTPKRYQRLEDGGRRRVDAILAELEELLA